MALLRCGGVLERARQRLMLKLGQGRVRPGRVRRALAFWREPRTVLIGLFVLAFGFSEGAGNNWIAA